MLFLGDCILSKPSGSGQLKFTIADGDPSAGLLSFFSGQINLGTGYFEGKNGGDINLTGVQITGTGSRLFAMDFSGRGVTMTVNAHGCDLSGGSWTNLYEPDNHGSFAIIRFVQCAFPASINLVSNAANLHPNSRIEVMGGSHGAITTAPFNYRHEERTGYSDTVLTHYRTGGADDGEQTNGYSQKITCRGTYTKDGVVFVRVPIGSIDIKDADGTTRTFKFPLAHDGVGAGTSGALRNNQAYVVGNGPDDQSTKDAAGVVIASWNWQDIVADIPLDAAAVWNGGGITIKQIISVAYAPTVNGRIDFDIYIATGSASDQIIYACPKTEVS